MRTATFALLVIGYVGGHIHANVVLDFSHDAQTDNFFGRHPVAKAAVEKAAADVNSMLDTTLLALDNQDTIDGTYGNTTVSLGWTANHNNPSTGDLVELDSISLNTDEVRIFVGMNELAGAVAGRGGPGSVNLTVGATGIPAELENAIANTEAEANRLLGRGGGPTNRTLSFSNLFGTNRNMDISVGMIVGELILDIDTNNDGRTDSDRQLADAWHYDANTPVAEGKIDMYSIALHEVLHAIGFGSAESWTHLAAGTNWLGEHAIEANGGSGTQLINGPHIRDGVQSIRVSEGQPQKPAMDSLLLIGTRAELTRLDLAFLEDMGWNLKIDEPLVGDFDRDGTLDVDDINLLSEATGSANQDFDLTQNGWVDLDDITVWVKELKNTWFGDANLDGEFTTLDLIEVFQTAKFETGLPAQWQEGDWDGNRLFTTTDFIIAFQDNGFEQGPRTLAAVPEPTHVVVILPCIFALVFWRQRRKDRNAEARRSQGCRWPQPYMECGRLLPL